MFRSVRVRLRKPRDQTVRGGINFSSISTASPSSKSDITCGNHQSSLQL